MKIKKMLPLLVILAVAVVGIFAFFILRPRNVDLDLIPQKLAIPPENPKPIAELKHGDSVQAKIGPVVFSPAGRLLASGSSDGTIILWDVSEKQHIKSLENRFDGALSLVRAVAFSPDGKWLASAGKHVKLWNINPIHNPMEKTTFTHADDASVGTIDFSPDGKLLAAGDSSGKVKVWDIQSDQAIIFQHGAAVWTVDFSPDGKLLAAGDIGGNVIVWDAQIGRAVKTLTVATLKGDPKQVYAVKFSPNSDNPILAGAGQSGIIRLWTLPDWQLQGTLTAPNTVPSLVFSRDGKVLASAGENLDLWSIENGAHITSLNGRTDWVNSVAISSDGTTLASGGKDGILRIWNVAPYVTPQQIDTRS